MIRLIINIVQTPTGNRVVFTSTDTATAMDAVGFSTMLVTSDAGQLERHRIITNES